MFSGVRSEEVAPAGWFIAVPITLVETFACTVAQGVAKIGYN